MRQWSSEARVGAIVIGGASFVLGAAMVLVSTAATSQADAPEDPPGANTAGPATLSYDLGGLPDGSVLVVERRNGPKGGFTEVARSTREAGGLEIGVPTDDRSILRFVVTDADGTVLARVDRQY